MRARERVRQTERRTLVFLPRVLRSGVPPTSGSRMAAGTHRQDGNGHSRTRTHFGNASSRPRRAGRSRFSANGWAGNERRTGRCVLHAAHLHRLRHRPARLRLPEGVNGSAPGAPRAPTAARRLRRRYGRHPRRAAHHPGPCPHARTRAATRASPSHGIKAVDIGRDFIFWTWDPLPGATRYQVRVYPEGSYEWDTVHVEEPSLLLEGLAPGVAVKIRVRVLQDTTDGRVGWPWSDFVLAETLRHCREPVPTNVG